MKSFWKSSKIGLVPGPTKVPAEVVEAMAFDFASSDIEDSFYEYYAATQLRVQRLLNTDSTVVIMTGEAMVTLWGALKSVLKPGDKVLAISTGLFGEGLGEMAAAIGAEVIYHKFDWDNPTLSSADLEAISKKASEIKPKLITTVHCETPAGSLNVSVPQIGKIASQVGALFCVDMVSSVAGAPVFVDEWKIDLALVGSQKALSCPPEFSFLSVSPRAWDTIEQVKYQGYDAILPFRKALEIVEFPYTPSWRALAALDVVLTNLETEDLEQVFARHIRCQEYTITRLEAMGLHIYQQDPKVRSPTVTAVTVPSNWEWKELNAALRAKDVALGGSFGKLANKVFRIGHMGSQANMELVKAGLDVLEQVLKSKFLLMSLNHLILVPIDGINNKL